MTDMYNIDEMFADLTLHFYFCNISRANPQCFDGLTEY